MSISRIGIVGAGAMGSGIAQSALAAGCCVVLFDQDAKALGSAVERILDRLKSEAEKGRLAREIAEGARERLRPAHTLAEMAEMEIVIEAIIERLDAKKALFSALEDAVAPGCVLASNTSSLPIAAIARDCTHADRVCGMHFFNPVPLMRLVEIVRGAETSPEALAAAHALAERLGKAAIDVADAPGFLVNLGGRAYVTEALHLVQEGASDFATIDAIMREACGFRMGPFELMDLTGIDVNYPVTKFIFEGYQAEPRLKTTFLHQLMVDAGRYGRKTGRGFHDYREASSIKRQDPPARTLQSQPFIAEDRMRAPLSGVLRRYGLVPKSGEKIILIEPLGEDAATVCFREGLDPKRVVAVDSTGMDRKVLTIMVPVGSHDAADEVAAWLSAIGFTVYTISDTPGFVAMRILSMIANLGCEIAQMRLASTQDIDRAMELGLNYPAGPLAIADRMGLSTVHSIMTNLQSVTGSDRYRPSLWLRQRAMLGLPACATH